MSARAWDAITDAALELAKSERLGDGRGAELAGALGRITHEILTAYEGAGIVRYCPVCEQWRLVTKPRRWDAEIVEHGGPEWTAECSRCGQTIDLFPRSRKRNGPDGATTRTAGDDAA